MGIGAGSLALLSTMPPEVADRMLELLHESKERVGSRLLAERVAIGHSSAKEFSAGA